MYYSNRTVHYGVSQFFDDKNAATWVVGLDGTKHSFLALNHAFRMARKGDKIYGYFIPVNASQYAYEHEFLPLNSKQEDKFEKNQSNFIETLKEKSLEIQEARDKNKEINFEVVVGEPSLSVKQDLIDATSELKADYLVLGSKGASHSIREKLEKKVTDILGSVPDFCVHNAKCSVIVVKPHNY